MTYVMLKPKQIKKLGSLVRLEKGQKVTAKDFPVEAQFQDFIKRGFIGESKAEEKPVLKTGAAHSTEQEALQRAIDRKAEIAKTEKLVEEGSEDSSSEPSEEEILAAAAEEGNDETSDPEKKEDSDKTPDPQSGVVGAIVLDDKTMELAQMSDEQYKAADPKLKRQITIAKKKLAKLTG